MYVMEKYLQTENVVMSDENMYINFQEWVDGHIDVLCITGYSGSGKSTLGKVLEKEYNCTLIELDVYRDEWIKDYILKNFKYLTIENKNFIIKNVHTTWELSKYLKSIDHDNKYEDYYYNVEKVLWYKELVKLVFHNNKRIILEGIWLSFLDDIYIKRMRTKIACIIMGTSVIKSTTRSMIRNMKTAKLATLWDYIDYSRHEIVNQYHLIKYMTKLIDNFKTIISK